MPFILFLLIYDVIWETVCSDVHSVADVMLWKQWCGGVFVLVGATFMWYLFERAGYNLLSFVANVLLLLVIILFFWAKSASILNRYS